MLDSSEDGCGVCAEHTIDKDAGGPAPVVRRDPRVVFGSFDRLRTGSGDFQQGVAEGLTVVGDVENMLLDSEMDRVGVERVVEISGRFETRPCGLLGASAGCGAEGLVQGVVDLGHKPGRLCLLFGLWRVVGGFGSRIGAWLGPGINLPGTFAESPVHEGVCGSDAVVRVGLFVVFGDVAQNLDELEAVVGHLEDGLGELEGRV